MAMKTARVQGARGSGGAAASGSSCRRPGAPARSAAGRRRGRAFHRGRRLAPARVFEDVPDGPQAGTTESLELFSPAKINLFLRITKKRPDGFHELASLFQTIAFGDMLSVRPLPSSATEDLITCNDPTVPCDERNLVAKAASLFRAKTGSQQRFAIDLDKEVPAGAGLGGGSGNAATMLFAATKLCGLEGTYSEDDLLEWSGDIGSDISFFFSSGTAYCTGRGEIVEDMPPALPDSYPIVLIKPMRPLSTAAVYKKLDVAKCSQLDPEQLKDDFYMDVLQKSNARERYPAQDLCLNDLEGPAFQEMPILARVSLKALSPYSLSLLSRAFALRLSLALSVRELS